MEKGRFSRKDKLIQQKRHDSYREREKCQEPALCNECGALLVNSRWTWKEPPEKTFETTCPACRRTADKYPAGFIEIKGDFFEKNRGEIFNLIKNVEKQEKTERPLERIMEITDRNDETLVTTTGVHIARRIGEALSHSYKGDFSFRYADDEKRIRVSWKR